MENIKYKIISYDQEIEENVVCQKNDLYSLLEKFIEEKGKVFCITAKSED